MEQLTAEQEREILLGGTKTDYVLVKVDPSPGRVLLTYHERLRANLQNNGAETVDVGGMAALQIFSQPRLYRVELRQSGGVLAVRHLEEMLHDQPYAEADVTRDPTKAREILDIAAQLEQGSTGGDFYLACRDVLARKQEMPSIVTVIY